jgi:C-terminal processing protease CtpA/Prc
MFGNRLTAELERREPGTTVKLTIERSDKKQTFSLTLAPPR